MASKVTFSSPGTQQIADANGNVTDVYAQYFSQMTRIVQTLQVSGTTAQRPTTNLWVGRFYYDETLGKPIWFHAFGSPDVWHDGAGVSV
jgi:hypothetical protein